MNVPVKPAIAAFLVLAAALAVGQRFGFRWAGGTGYEAAREAGVAYLVGTASIDRNGTSRPLGKSSTVARGEIVSTEAGGRVGLEVYQGMHLFLDERTTVEIAQNDPRRILFDVKRGRVVFDTHADRPYPGLLPPITVKTGRNTATIDHGALSVTHYDFLWRADIWPVNAAATVTSPADGTFTTADGVHVSTDGSAKSVPSRIDYDAGAGAAFYKWIQDTDPFH